MALDELLNEKSDINARDEKGRTPLYRTLAPSPKPNTLELILTLTSPDLSLKDDEGRDVFEFAQGARREIKETQTQKISLLDRCIDTLDVYKERLVALHRQWNLFDAVRRGSLDEIKELLKKGAWVNLPNDEGLTPLTLALTLENQPIFNLLARHGGVLSQNRRYEVIGPIEEEEREEKEKYIGLLARQNEDLSRHLERQSEELKASYSALQNAQTQNEKLKAFRFWILLALALTTIWLAARLYKKKKFVQPSSAQKNNEKQEETSEVLSQHSDTINDRCDPACDKEADDLHSRVRDALIRAATGQALDLIRGAAPFMHNGRPMLNHYFQAGRPIDSEFLFDYSKTLMEYRKEEMTPEVLSKHLDTIKDRCDPACGREAIDYLRSQLEKAETERSRIGSTPR
jgi:hypothetical protein